MKITVEHAECEENEMILRCRELDDEILRLLELVRSGMKKLLESDIVVLVFWRNSTEKAPLRSNVISLSGKPSASQKMGCSLNSAQNYPIQSGIGISNNS